MQEARIIEFTVGQITVRPDGAEIIGRCINSPIVVGDCFSFVHGDKRVDAAPLSLCVTSIAVWPVYDLTEIEPGYVGRITLVGRGSELLTDGVDILQGSSTIARPSQCGKGRISKDYLEAYMDHRKLQIAKDQLVRLQKALPSGKVFKLACDAEVQFQAEWLFRFLSKLESQRKVLEEGVRVQIGWSVLTIRKNGGEYAVYEPNFFGDPFNELCEDVTISLKMMAEQSLALNSLGYSHAAIRFDDTMRILGGSVDAKWLFLKRETSSPGSSGWSVAPALAGDHPKAEWTSIYTYQLLKLRPQLLRVLALPAGLSLIFDGNSIQTLVASEESLQMHLGNLGLK